MLGSRDPVLYTSDDLVRRGLTPDGAVVGVVLEGPEPVLTRTSYLHECETEMFDSDDGVHVVKFVEFSHFEEQERVEVTGLHLPPLTNPLVPREKPPNQWLSFAI